MTNTNAEMILKGLEFFVSLGWEAKERIERQRVHVDIHIQFLQPPGACKTDNLEDTVCYDTLNKKIKSIIENKAFHLIEHLTYDIYSHVKTSLSVKNKISIGVTKYPDLFLTSKGISFWYGEK